MAEAMTREELKILRQRAEAIYAGGSKDVLWGKIIDAYEAQGRENDVLRMQLHACGDASKGNMRNSLCLGEENEAWSKDYALVCRAVEREMYHREAAEKLQAEVTRLRRLAVEGPGQRMVSLDRNALMISGDPASSYGFPYEAKSMHNALVLAMHSMNDILHDRINAMHRRLIALEAKG